MSIETRELTPERWPALERLFGKNGACGGCWCMSWRIQDGEHWDDVKGATAKRRMKALVKKGQKLPAAFAWTGTPSLFLKNGFEVAGNAGGSKQRVRRAP